MKLIRFGEANKEKPGIFFGEETKYVNMIKVASDNNWIAFKVFANPSKIIVEFCVNRRGDKWLSMLCAKDDVQIVFIQRLSHTIL